MSYTLGIDIGTSKTAAVIVDKNKKIPIASASIKTEADISAPEGYSEQDSVKILNTISNMITSFVPELREKVSAIGVTGQMHGVVLWNNSEISPLYTWKDRRTAEDGFIDKIKKIPGCEGMKEGFGNTTLAYLAEKKKLDKWNYAATIQDYFVYKICGLGKPLTDSSDAASWGLFDIRKKQWDIQAIKKLEIPKRFLPDIVPSGSEAGRLSGRYAQIMGLPKNIPVYVAIGDNQASILGTSQNRKEEIYLTIGTGAQLSVIISEDDVDNLEYPETIEIRPFINKEYLVVVAPLCGGQAFAWLISSIQTWLRELGINAPSQEKLYKIIDSLAMNSIESQLLIKPNFLGERHNPFLRGEISGIDLNNFSLGNISAALASGIIENLHSMVPKELFKNKKMVICSGNAIRRLKIFRKAIEGIFSLPIRISEYSEEAAVGGCKEFFKKC